jgi:signal transduction histidine kinase/NAD-dependent dihydropyrimidine dehydrogenase PreA subunit
MGPRPLVQTIKERCRVCYTCVRECPAKAIRIAEGQAEVLVERCIGCGNCVRVCSQRAKEVLSGIGEVGRLLASGAKVAVCLAPSFPAEFAEFDYPRVVGMLRALGFAFVHEVAFGADLVAKEYARLLADSDGGRFIATTCPAIVGFVERYNPELIPHLAPVVSPMIATARVLRQMRGDDLKVVFIGPCIAKKGEGAGGYGTTDLDEEPEAAGEIDAALTFVELRQLLAARNIRADAVTASEFDPPHGFLGALFPVSRGMLQAAGIHEDLLEGGVTVADGRANFVDAIKEFEFGDPDARLLEVLCCQGCVMGAGMSGESPLLSRRARVRQYVRRRVASLDRQEWQRQMDRFAAVDLGREFTVRDQRILVPFSEELAMIMGRMGKFKPEDELNCGACGYDTCREHAIAIFKGLAESEMCLPHTIEELRRTIDKLEVSKDQLASTQEALMQSEKLASMGQLAAGIAHEVNNPLGIVVMYAHLLMEEAGKHPELRDDLGMIAEQADRCKRIVAGLLHFARQNKVTLLPADLPELVESALRGLPSQESVDVVVENTLAEAEAEVDRDQIIQVLTNLVSNAYAAMPQGGRLTIRLDGDEEKVRLCVRDTGVGIPQENLSKIFEPFFTTKQMGKGTGLGLAVTYGIVKMHRGDIRVESNANPDVGATGTTFTVTLPRRSEGERAVRGQAGRNDV